MARNRAILRILQSAADRGLAVNEAGMGKAVELAEQIIDDASSTTRDRLRAAEFLSSIVGRAVAIAIDEMGRPDWPPPNEPPPAGSCR